MRAKRMSLLTITLIIVVLMQMSLAKKQFKRDIMYPGYNEPVLSHHHHHHGRPRPGPGMTKPPPNRAVTGPNRNIPREIPLSFLQRLNDLESVNDFLHYVTGNISNPGETFDIINRFGEGEEIDRKALATPKLASCIPELQVVPLHIKDPDPSMFYYPSCTRVMRCGGCCSSSILSCQPKETKLVNYKVFATQYTGVNNKLSLRSEEIVTVEEHTKCGCGCLVKITDCTSNQIYREEDCKCECVNIDEHQKCLMENRTKIWDYHDCSCKCRNVQECSTGYTFNPNMCMCTEILDRKTRRQAGSKLKFVPRPVLPIENNDGNSDI